MSAPLLHQGASVQCLHAGQAEPSTVSQRVKVSGQAIVLQSYNHTISGCSLPVIAGGPCVTAQWVSAATRVTSEGVPVLLQNSQAVCTPTGTGLLIMSTQTRATAI